MSPREEGGSDADLRRLAECAGIAVEWHDYQGRPQTVRPGTLRRVLAALGHPCDTAAQAAQSLQALTAAVEWPVMVTGRVGMPLLVPVPPSAASGELRAELTLETGETLDMKAAIVSPPASPRPDEVWNGQAPGLSIGLSLGPVGTPGYHRLAVTAGGQPHHLTLAIAPRHAYRVEDALAAQAQAHGTRAPDRAWGTAVQLYGLPPESDRPLGDAGIGDFTALAALARGAAEAGAHALAISPTHAEFAADPSKFSPYSPSSRWFFNVLHVDPAAVFGAAVAEAAARRAGIEAAELAALRDAPQIDWPRSGAVKMRWLRALFDLVDAPGDVAGKVAGGDGASPDWKRDFDRFAAEQGEPLALHACFEALHAKFAPQGLGDWRRWPEALRDPRGEEVARFKREHAAELRFHAFLQWLADTGLARAQQAARRAGMAVGLVSDLAVGLDSGGSHAWSRPDELLAGLEVGAPPDMLNTDGQTWGLTALSPRAMREGGFAAFLSTLRAAMRHAGGVRIDHVLGLKRLWLVPQGAGAGEGAYLHYPFDDLLNLVALESHRHRAIVIGEDLGTVPSGLRDKLADLSILGMRVLWFERDPASPDGAGFLPPAQWPRDAVALTTTHDLATAAGWWLGRDIDWRERIGGADAAASRTERARDREALRRACGASDGEIGAQGAVDLAVDQVAATPAVLAIVPLEDLLGLAEQPNLPGTVDEHPNWRRRLPSPADRLLAQAPVSSRAARLSRGRGEEGRA